MNSSDTAGAPSALVTGATGFVGGHLVDELVRGGWRVTCLVRPTSDTRELARRPVRLEAVSLPGAGAALARIVSGHEIVFHLAGAVRARNADEFRRANADVTGELGAACVTAAQPPRRFVLVSSVGAVGPAAGVAAVTDDQPPRPVSDYGRSKLEGERRALALADRLHVVIVRPTVIYGPRDRELLVAFRLARRGLVPLLGGREQVVSLAHVDDVVQALLRAATADVASGEAFLVGGPEEVSMVDLGARLCALFGRRPIYLPLPRPLLRLAALGAEGWAALRRQPAMLTRQKLPELWASWRLDLGHAGARLGYAPRWALADGLRHALAWYRAAGWIAADG